MMPARWLERLSLDAVFVAVLWGMSLGAAAGGMPPPGELGVLAMATWLTYVADRLRDVRSGRPVPLTDRHLYYQNHYNEFRGAWLAGFLVVVPAALLMLPAWKFAGGWVLVGGILLYLWLVGKIRAASARLLLKRTAVPLIFTLGTAWMAEAWRTGAGLATAAVLLAGALANVLLISRREADPETAPGWLSPAAAGSVGLLALACLAAFPFHWPAGVAALYGTAVFAFLLNRIRETGLDHIRMWADAALADMAILFLLLEWLFR